MINFDEFVTYDNLQALFVIFVFFTLLAYMLINWLYEKYTLRPIYKKIDKRLTDLEKKTSDKD